MYADDELMGSLDERDGPYCQLSYNRKGKSTARFVRKKNLLTVKR